MNEFNYHKLFEADPSKSMLLKHFIFANNDQKQQLAHSLATSQCFVENIPENYRKVVWNSASAADKDLLSGAPQFLLLNATFSVLGPEYGMEFIAVLFDNVHRIFNKKPELAAELQSDDLFKAAFYYNCFGYKEKDFAQAIFGPPEPSPMSSKELMTIDLENLGQSALIAISTHPSCAKNLVAKLKMCKTFVELEKFCKILKKKMMNWPSWLFHQSVRLFSFIFGHCLKANLNSELLF
ncbi:hypothetical protein P9112_010981 [Eukaryota sp. TZLM1-RC]